MPAYVQEVNQIKQITQFIVYVILEPYLQQGYVYLAAAVHPNNLPQLWKCHEE